jgi:hypothetical protein
MCSRLPTHLCLGRGGVQLCSHVASPGPCHQHLKVLRHYVATPGCVLHAVCVLQPVGRGIHQGVAAMVEPHGHLGTTVMNVSGQQTKSRVGGAKSNLAESADKPHGVCHGRMVSQCSPA